MLHNMKLNPAPFALIKSGQKRIEMRLYDEKRAKIKVGDWIEFSNVETGEKLLCGVLNAYLYPTFEELYRHHDKISIGYTEGENADPKDMLAYYSREEIMRYGVVAIEIEVKMD